MEGAKLSSGAGATDSVVGTDRSPLSDAALVAAARGGDMRAFERLYRLHAGRVMGVCLRMTRRRDLAEDCVQQTFVRAWRNLAAFEGRSAFGTWLHRIAVNEVLTYARNHGTRVEGSDVSIDDVAEGRDAASESASELYARALSSSTQASSTHSSSMMALDASDVMDVEQALATLPEGARHVVVLQAVYGYSHEEVADMLGIAVGTCKAQLHRGRRLLRERMGLKELEP